MLEQEKAKRFQFLMVRLKVECEDCKKRQVMIFQFLMVRLKVTDEMGNIISDEFQFLMVRLKVAFIE